MRAGKFWKCFAALLLLSLVGCMEQVYPRDRLVGSSDEEDALDAGTGGASSVPTDDETLAILASGSFRNSTAFRHVSGSAYPSSAVSGAFIDLYVSSDAYSEYAMISPGATGSGAVLPPGAIIVRVVSDVSGTVQKLTAMRHGPNGINPTLDDWWFAETDPNGVPITDDAGPLIGPLTDCMSCHLGRSGDDFLFGVPTDER